MFLLACKSVSKCSDLSCGGLPNLPLFPSLSSLIFCIFLRFRFALVIFLVKARGFFGASWTKKELWHTWPVPRFFLVFAVRVKWRFVPHHSMPFWRQILRPVLLFHPSVNLTGYSKVLLRERCLSRSTMLGSRSNISWSWKCPGRLFSWICLQETVNMLLKLSQKQQLCHCSLCFQDGVGGEELWRSWYLVTWSDCIACFSAFKWLVFHDWISWAAEHMVTSGMLQCLSDYLLLWVKFVKYKSDLV